jgi:nucleoside-diphosphate-sugar epimerase
MRVLIAGCGYIGLPLGTLLAGQGHEIFGLRRSVSAKGELASAGIHPLFGDITRREDLAGLPAPFDWVVNCAASGGGTVADYRRVYLQGTRNLIEWLTPLHPGKYVHTSSTSVYGQNDGSLVDETSATEPVSETAQVLVETEKLLLEAAQHRHFPAVILRLAGIYGPGRGHWFRQFLSGDARIEGNGGRILNMIHRDDAAGCVSAALQQGRPGEVYNAVDDEPASQIDFYRWLSGRLNRNMPPFAPEDAEAIRKRGVTNKKVSNEKLKAELKYRFRHPTFRQGCETEISGLGTGAVDLDLKTRRTGDY